MSLPRCHTFILSRNDCNGGGDRLFFISPRASRPFRGSVCLARGNGKLNSATGSVVRRSNGVCIMMGISGGLLGLGNSNIRRTRCDFSRGLNRPHCVYRRSNGLCISDCNNCMDHFSTGALTLRTSMGMSTGPRRLIRRSSMVCMMYSNCNTNGALYAVGAGAFSGTRSVRVTGGPRHVMRDSSRVCILTNDPSCGPTGCSCSATICACGPRAGGYSCVTGTAGVVTCSNGLCFAGSASPS